MNSLRLHRPWRWILLLLLVAAGVGGCAALDEQQRRWIFQPGDRTWGSSAMAAEGMDEVWIAYRPSAGGAEASLHGLWLGQPAANAPVLLYLHGARWDVRSSAGRMRRLHDMGFAVLGIDYRGFGRSTEVLPSEASTAEDARAAWRWLAARYPQSRRFVFGHSLGGAVAVQLAADVDDEAGLIVEGSFPSIPDVVRSFRWGWLPVAPLITQRLDAGARIADIGSPLVVLHGSADSVIAPELGRALYERAKPPKRFVLVDGGSHHNSNILGRAQLQQAVQELFGIGGEITLSKAPTPPLATSSR